MICNLIFNCRKLIQLYSSFYDRIILIEILNNKKIIIIVLKKIVGYYIKKISVRHICYLC